MADPITLARLDDDALAVLFAGARTANTFADTPVSDEELAAIWDTTKWGPTAANTQPLRILWVRSPEGEQRLVRHMSDGNKAKTASAPAVAVLAVDTRFHEHIPALLPFRPELRDVFEANEEMRVRTSALSSGLQAGYFILAVRAHGLAAGPRGGFDAEGVDREFFADGRWRSILVVNVGHPGTDPWFDRLPRLDASETEHWA